MITTEFNSLIVIFLMGLAIFVIRCLGYWIGGHLPVNKKIETWLNHLPGCIMISIVAPFVLTAGPIQYAGALITALAMWFTDSLLLAMILGIGVVVISKIYF